MSQPPHSQIPGSEVKKKGMPALAWVGIGCGGIVLIGIVCVVLAGVWGYNKAKEVTKELTSNPGKRGAELLVGMNEDLQKVSENDAAGEMTIRLKSTGEERTLKYDDIANGRFTQFVKGDLAKVPSWVPRYPGAVDEASAMQSENARKVSGVITFATRDSTETIQKFYEDEAGKLSLGSSSSSSLNLNKTAMLNIEFKGGKRVMNISASGESGGLLNVLVAYAEEK